MNKREVTEIKRRLKKETCTFQKMAGCYVDSSKEKVVTFTNTFLNLEDEEFYKYLEIANKTLSGKVGNNLIELSFPTDTEVDGGPQASLMALRNSGLKDENILNAFYDHVIETYDFVENYLILLFHDVYDIPMKTTDEFSIGDSEEIYDYILCAICPVALSKPGLSYHAENNTIAALNRDWVVGAVDTGFTFPAFTNRSTDIHSIMVYTKNAKEPHKEFWENGLGCQSRYTSTEKKNAFTDMMTHALGGESKADAEDVLTDVQQSLAVYIEEEAKTADQDEPILLPAEEISVILTDNGFSEEDAQAVQKEYEEFFGEETPEAEELLDSKLLKDNEKRVENKVLREKLLDSVKQLKDAGLLTEEGNAATIYVKIDEDRVPEIQTAFVDGRRCLVIPLEDDDETVVNGETQYY